jgi:hypothetical protein
VKVREVFRILQDDGWTLVVARGSHRPVQVPDRARPCDCQRPTWRRHAERDVRVCEAPGRVERGEIMKRLRYLVRINKDSTAIGARLFPICRDASPPVRQSTQPSGASRQRFNSISAECGLTVFGFRAPASESQCRAGHHDRWTSTQLSRLLPERLLLTPASSPRTSVCSRRRAQVVRVSRSGCA